MKLSSSGLFWDLAGAGWAGVWGAGSCSWSKRACQVSSKYLEFWVSFSDKILKKSLLLLLTPEKMFSVGSIFKAKHKDALTSAFRSWELVVTYIGNIVFLRVKGPYIHCVSLLIDPLDCESSELILSRSKQPVPSFWNDFLPIQLASSCLDLEGLASREPTHPSTCLHYY